MTKGLYRVGLIALLAWAVSPSVARACDCVNAGPACKAFANTQAIFAGRVTKIASADTTHRLVTFDVTTAYRGMTDKTAEISTGMGGGDCGFEFKEGGSYLVYAAPDSATGKLSTGICMRTRLLGEAKDDIEYLTHKDDPAHGSGIEGDIMALTRDAKNVTTVTGPLAGITVTISGVSLRKTVVTRKDGHFQLWGLDPGAYRVSPTLPDSFLKTAQTLKLAAQSCEEVHFLATPPPKKNP
jgi:hypothetical protein